MVQIPFSSLLSDPETDDQFQLSIDSSYPMGPPGLYHFEDYYCPESDCDCRRVTLVVVDQHEEEHAVITYGWMPYSFYYSFGDNSEADDDFSFDLSKGYLEPFDDQSDNAPFFFDCFVHYFRDETLFREWLERRYRLFKEAVAAQDNKTATVIPFVKKQ